MKSNSESSSTSSSIDSSQVDINNSSIIDLTYANCETNHKRGIKRKDHYNDLFSFFTVRKSEHAVSNTPCSARNVPSWNDDETFISDYKCPVQSCIVCTYCLECMFSTKKRGKTIADQEWFNDKFADHVNNPRYELYPSLRERLFHNLRNHEIDLRLISRKDVYNALVDRFRGYYRYGKKDVIDKIINEYHFTSIKQWCLWKCKQDKLFLTEYHSIRNNTLFCSGCGHKCVRFQSKKTLDHFQKCSNNQCDFFYKEDATFARIKK